MKSRADDNLLTTATPAAIEPVLTLPEVAAIMRTSVHALHCKLSRGTMLPLPIADFPYRWNRENIERWKRGEFREAEAKLRRRAKTRTSLKLTSR